MDKSKASPLEAEAIERVRDEILRQLEGHGKVEIQQLGTQLLWRVSTTSAAYTSFCLDLLPLVRLAAKVLNPNALSGSSWADYPDRG